MFQITAVIAITLGAFGLVWATFGAPILVAAVALVKRGAVVLSQSLSRLLCCRSVSQANLTNNVPVPVASSTHVHLSVLIPVFNGCRELETTLRSVNRALQQAEALNEGTIARFTSEVVVVDDGSTDQSAEVAASFGATVVSLSSNVGKWRAILTGITKILSSARISCEDRWIALVDTGAVWQGELVQRLLPTLNDTSVVGVAPRYEDSRSSTVGRVLWKIESILKRLESFGRGPTSVHGATVFYRASALVEPLKILSGRSWLNDDVVVPLLIRACNPHRRLVYAHELVVQDVSAAPSIDSMKNRRVRMMKGNLQWLQELLPEVMRRDFGTVVVLSRRAARIFWAYWIALLTIGTAIAVITPRLSTDSLLESSTYIILVSGVVATGMWCCSGAARASLLAPLILFYQQFTSDEVLGGIRWR